MVERILAGFLLRSRWLMAPFFVGLVVALAVLMVKAGQELFHVVAQATTASGQDTILDVLGLIELTLTGSLVVIVIFSGYENFVSRIDAGARGDWPEWLGKIDFSGLKLKLMSSIVAISAIQLLEAFMNLSHVSDRDLFWYVVILAVFVASSLVLALGDRLAGKERHGPIR